MIGKIVKVNDYKFVYGKDTVYINVYGAFKYKKNGNKYIVFSYDNKKLYYGSLFIKNNSIIIMTSKDDSNEVASSFINGILNNSINEEFEIISIAQIESAEIIDQHELNISVDINKLNDLTIPKPKVETKKEEKPKKKISIWSILIIVLILSLLAFFFINPEIIMGKNEEYICTKSYFHDKLPASVNESVSLLFSSKKKIISIDITSNYVFTDTTYYKEFKDKSYFYQFIKEGDTYKFDDTSYTYKLFSKIDTKVDYFMPKEEEELISYYKKGNYTCKIVKESD